MNHFKHRFREEIICKSVKWIAKTIDVMQTKVFTKSYSLILTNQLVPYKPKCRRLFKEFKD